MIVRFEEDEYIAVQFLMQESQGYRQMEANDEIFSYLDRRYEAADFYTISEALLSLAMRDMKNCRKW